MEKWSWIRAAGFGLVLAVAMPALAAETKRSSLHFVDVPVSELVRLVWADVLRRDVLIDAVLDGRVTIRLDDVAPATVFDAVTRVLELRGLEVKKGAFDHIRQKEMPVEVESSWVYRPKYRGVDILSDAVSMVPGVRVGRGGGGMPQAADVVHQGPGAAVQQGKQAGLGATMGGSLGGSSGPARSEVLVAYGTEAALGSARLLVAELDKARGEVIVEGQLIEVTRQSRDERGVELVFSALRGLAVAAGTAVPGAYRIAYEAGGLKAVLHALEADGRFKSVSSPRIRVASGERARLVVGQDVPVLGGLQFRGDGREPVQSVEYQEAGTILEIRPEIRESTISLEIRQAQSGFEATASGVNASPTRTKRELSTRVDLAKTGELLVLGGLGATTVTDRKSGVFGLTLFTSGDDEERELVLMLAVRELKEGI